MNKERNLRRKGNLSSCIPSSSPSQSSLLAIDRISTLPDPILHDIFNLLPTRYVARTSVLSNRFNALWLTNPILNFNEFDHHRKKHKDKLLDRMKRSYQSHDFTFLEKLKIRAREPIKKVFNKNLSMEVDRFILKAVHADTLREIQLQFPVSKKTPMVESLSDIEKFHPRFYLLPEIPVFSFCKSLKVLKLRGCRFEGNVKVNDHGVILPFLKELVLKYCVIPDDNFVLKCIDGCPQLDNLSFKFCLPGRKIHFFSSKLKKLVLGCYDSTTIYEIAAPNLESLKITGTSWRYTLNDGMRFQHHHIISAPNLEKICFKNILLSNEGIAMALSAFKSLKELELHHCFLTDEPKFQSDKITKLTISNCIFIEGNLFISSLKLPQAKFVNLCSCTGLKKLTLHSRNLMFSVKACQTVREFHKINLINNN